MRNRLTRRSATPSDQARPDPADGFQSSHLHGSFILARGRASEPAARHHRNWHDARLFARAFRDVTSSRNAIFSSRRRRLHVGGSVVGHRLGAGIIRNDYRPRVGPRCGSVFGRLSDARACSSQFLGVGGGLPAPAGPPAPAARCHDAVALISRPTTQRETIAARGGGTLEHTSADPAFQSPSFGDDPAATMSNWVRIDLPAAL